MMTKNLKAMALASTAFAFAACLISSAVAAPINYGDFSDIPPGSVMYLDVTETANTPGDEEPLYGPPSVTGNKLDFDPSSFSASAAAGGADLTDGQLNFTMMAAPSSTINSISVRESGDYSLLGSGSAVTQVIYSAAITTVSVTEIDGVAISPIAIGGVSASGGDDLSGGTDALSLWSLGLLFDVNAALDTAGVSYMHGATKLEVAINNQMAAISEASSIAFIAKKDFMVDAETTPFIPEPTSLGLLGMALCGLGLMGRRQG